MTFSCLHDSLNMFCKAETLIKKYIVINTFLLLICIYISISVCPKLFSKLNVLLHAKVFGPIRASQPFNLRQAKTLTYKLVKWCKVNAVQLANQATSAQVNDVRDTFLQAVQFAFALVFVPLTEMGSQLPRLTSAHTSQQTSQFAILLAS